MNAHALPAIPCWLLALLFVFSPSLADEPIYIGLNTDLSGSAAGGGLAVQRGALIAIDEINKQGGVLGRPLKLITRDNRSNPRRGLANTTAMLDEYNIAAMIGPIQTPITLQDLPIIHEREVIYLAPWAAGNPVVDNGYSPNYVFRVSLRDEFVAKSMVQRSLAKEKKKLGLLLLNSAWGRSCEKSIHAAAKTSGAEVVGVEWFNWSQKDMSIQVDNLIAAGAEVVLLVANAVDGAVAVKKMASVEAEKRLPIISHWGLAHGKFFKLAGAHNLEAVDLEVLQSFSFQGSSNRVLSEKVLEDYKKKFDANIKPLTVKAASGVANTYDLVHLFAKALAQANSTNGKDLLEAMENLPSYEGLVKFYEKPFAANRHDALNEQDYLLTKFNKQGHLIPIADS